MIIIDRMEEQLAVLETDSGSIEVARSQLPPDAKEGDVLKQTCNGYLVDVQQTNRRREALLRRTKKLRKEI